MCYQPLNERETFVNIKWRVDHTPGKKKNCSKIVNDKENPMKKLNFLFKTIEQLILSKILKIQSFNYQ